MVKSKIVFFLLISVFFLVGCSPHMSVRDSQLGWRLANEQVDVFITKDGGHMAPVLFYKDSPEPIQPYYISPWQNEALDDLHPLLDTIRGDFFCMPFGANAEPYKGEKHEVHGETACDNWNFVQLIESGPAKTIVMDINTKVRKGHVTKKISIVEGQNVLYIKHILEGFKGKMPIGHHANLSVPDKKGALKVSVGKFDLGMTNPTVFSNPINREYQSLALNQTFESLEKVPLLWKKPAFGDCSSFPVRQGFTDILYIYKKPAPYPAWTTAVNQEEGYIWFAIKDASVLPCTTVWISNKGRHGPPWNGRNQCLALEETRACFADGLSASVRPNIIEEKGFSTSVDLSPDTPFVINMIQGLVRVSDDFAKVKAVEFGPDSLRFVSEKNQNVTVKVNWNFVKTSTLEGI